MITFKFTFYVVPWHFRKSLLNGLFLLRTFKPRAEWAALVLEEEWQLQQSGLSYGERMPGTVPKNDEWQTWRGAEDREPLKGC